MEKKTMRKITRPLAVAMATTTFTNSEWPLIATMAPKFNHEGFSLKLQDAMADVSAEDLHEFLKETVCF